MQPEVWASIISAATALVAVIVGPFVSYRAGKRQMLGPMRQAWINDLRDNLSLYISLISINRWNTLASLDEPKDVRDRKQTEDRERFQEAIRLREKIFLLLNHNEGKHKTLAGFVQKAFDAYNSCEDTTQPLLDLRLYSQVVLKTEWNVIKS
jgi:hypothetical protein